MHKLWLFSIFLIFNCTLNIDVVFTQGPNETPMVTKDLGNGHIIRCYTQGLIPHPTDQYKYVVCEYVASGPNKGWWIHIMGCAPGMRWHQSTLNCIQDDEPTTQEPETVSPVVTKDLGNGHIIRCYKQGMIPHPTDRYKYVVCEYIPEGKNKGWWIHIMGCAPGTRWNQPTQNCIEDV
jgi:sarcosine oxidase delta subunit